MNHPRFSPRIRHVLSDPLGFLGRVVRGFQESRGFLLASAVAYNTLLSLIPVLALFSIALSHVVDPALILETTGEYLGLIAPEQAGALTSQLSKILENRNLVGFIGLIVLLFFSSFAFSALENAMAMIFSHRLARHSRRFWVSATLPYVFVLVLGAALMLVTMINLAIGALQAATGDGGVVGAMGGGVVRVIGWAGEALLFAAIYHVMPYGRVPVRHALIGGVTAALLWELVRAVLVWWFASLSMVSVIYGAFATVIVVLLSMEVAAIILLLGAQVIAEYERIPVSGDMAGASR
jgi:YihY family inner membrane protein